jgi:hypothetical protein
MRHLTLRAIVVVTLACSAAPAGATEYFITVGADDATTNGNCTLREALIAANTNAARDACLAGSPTSADVIQLIGGYSWTLGHFEVTGGELVIRGIVTPPFTTLLDLGDVSRFLGVFGGAAVTLEDLNVRDGNAIAHAVNPRGGFVYAVNSALTLRNVNVASSRASEGGGVYFASMGPSLLVERCQLVDNAAEGSSGQAPSSGGQVGMEIDGAVVARGGALYVSLGGAARARLADNRLAGNQARSTVGGQAAQGGAFYGELFSNAVIEVVRADFDGNVAVPGSGGSSAGGGAMLLGFDASRVTVSDTTWTDNDLQGSGTFGSGLWFGSYGTATRLLERARFVGNDLGQPPFQLYLEAFGQSTLVASNVLVADGGQIGMRGFAGQTSTLRIGHATVVGASTGAVLVSEGAGVVRVESSLFWNNSVVDVVDTSPSALDPSTMTGVDPLFVSPGTGDYRLGPGSPAADFGNRLLPSVGPWDLAHAPRIVGAQTDAGAFERSGLFGDDFESGDTGAWSADVP